MNVAEINDFIVWHELIIAQYPALIANELRQTRTKWLAGMKRQAVDA